MGFSRFTGASDIAPVFYAKMDPGERSIFGNARLHGPRAGENSAGLSVISGFD